MRFLPTTTLQGMAICYLHDVDCAFYIIKILEFVVGCTIFFEVGEYNVSVQELTGEQSLFIAA